MPLASAGGIGCRLMPRVERSCMCNLLCEHHPCGLPPAEASGYSQRLYRAVPLFCCALIYFSAHLFHSALALLRPYPAVDLFFDCTLILLRTYFTVHLPHPYFTRVTLCPGTFAAGFGGFCRGFLRHLHPGIPCSAHLLKGSQNWYPSASSLFLL